MNSTLTNYPKFKIVTNGDTLYKQYNRYQNDFFHTLNMSNIKCRKNRFLFSKKNASSYGKPKNFARLKDPLKETIHLEYLVNRDNRYLGERLNAISKRPFKTEYKYDAAFVKKQGMYNDSIRKLWLKKVIQDNKYLYRKVNSVESQLNHKNLERMYDEIQRKSRHLKKIQPLSTSTNFRTMTTSVGKSKNNQTTGNEELPKINEGKNTNKY